MFAGEVRKWERDISEGTWKSFEWIFEVDEFFFRRQDGEEVSDGFCIVWKDDFVKKTCQRIKIEKKLSEEELDASKWKTHR